MSIKLRGGTMALAIKLQEAMDSGDSLSANDIRTRLCDAINDQYRGTGRYAYCIDYFGDAESGDVIYSCDADTFRASYEMSGGAGAQKCIIDFEGADDVVPRTIYETEADEGEHLASMESAKAGKLYGESVPLYERFISKSERDKASSGSFAGKGKSFPILKAGDVAAAASSLGRAGSGNYSTDVIKRNIIRIAKEKGWTSELPKAWRGDTDSKESARYQSHGLKLVEMTTRADEAAIDLIESAAGSEMEIKLIAPGKGSSAFYTPEALKQAAADKVFDKGTQIFINHATRAEESERPEGDWHKLVGALKEPAYYLESHKQGPGLYSKAAFAPDMAPLIKAKAPYSGMSIRANGDAVMESGRPAMREGVPLLKRFTTAESVDIVTKAGAGGMILTESARGATQQESTMTAEEKRLLESLVNDRLRQQAITEGAKILGAVAISEAQREYVMDNVLAKPIPTVEGNTLQLDATKFRESMSAELSRFGAAMGIQHRVTGMGSSSATTQLTEADRQRIAEQQKAEEISVKESWAGLLGTDNAAVLDRATKGRVN